MDLVASLTLIAWSGWIFGAVGAVVGVVAGLLGLGHRKELRRLRDENKDLHDEVIANTSQKAAEIAASGRQTLVEIQSKYGRTPPIWCPPRSRDEDHRFVGRRDLLGGILASFATETVPKRIVVVLHGRPGIGKSSLALRLAEIFGADSPSPVRGDGLLWSELGERPPSLESILLTWLRAKNMDAEPSDAEGVEAIVGAISTCLNHRRPLVVIDDVWQLDHARPFLEAAATCPVLLTTADGDVATEIENAYAGRREEVEALPDSDAEELVASVLKADLARRLPEGYVAHLCSRVDRDPFSLIQLGAHVRDTLAPQAGQISGASDRDLLDDLVLAPLAKIAGRRVGQPGKSERISGPELYRARLQQAWTAPTTRVLLETLALVHPRPAYFTAEELTVMAGLVDTEPVRDALDNLARRSLVESDQVDPSELASTPDGTTNGYSLHWLARAAVPTVDSTTTQQTHRRAAAYWNTIVDPSHGQLTSYQSALHRESRTWLRAASNLLHHLGQLDDRRVARLTFDKLYLELFWWWGYYHRYKNLDALIEDWRHAERPDSAAGDQSWLDAIVAFHREYQPAHDGRFLVTADWKRNDWVSIEAALRTILKLDGLDGDADELPTHTEWHVRALADIFLAHSYRHRPISPPDAEAKIDDLYAEARRLYMRCRDRPRDDPYNSQSNEECEWNLPWIDYEEGETALERAQHDNQHYARAVEKAVLAVRSVLEDDGEEGREAPLLRDQHAIDDWEIIARGSRLWGDALFNSEGPTAATNAYEAAVVVAFAWQYRQKSEPTSDDYTQAFYGDILRHVLDQIERVRASDVGQATSLANHFLRLREAFTDDAPSPQPDLSAVAGAERDFRDALLAGAFGLSTHHPYEHRPEPKALSQHVDRVLERLWRETGKRRAATSGAPLAAAGQ